MSSSPQDAQEEAADRDELEEQQVNAETEGGKLGRLAIAQTPSPIEVPP